MEFTFVSHINMIYMAYSRLRTAGQRLTKNIKGQFDDLVEAFTGRTFPAGSGRVIFPAEMEQVFDSRPMINFSCKASKDLDDRCGIFLPCPPGINFTDAGSYSSMDLGMIGGAAELAGGAVKAIREKGLKKATSDAMAAGKAKIDSLVQKVGSASAQSIGETSMQVLGAVGGEGHSFDAKQVANPRQNTKFDANSLRTFQFSFKMIARTAEESKRVQQIHTLFRYGIYADEITPGAFLLKYPPTWVVRFMVGGEENPFIPKILRCYLTSVTSTFNSTGNTWRVDGAPLEVDIALSFQETRVLTRKDIEDLENGKNRDEFEQKASVTGAAIEAATKNKQQSAIDAGESGQQVGEN